MVTQDQIDVEIEKLPLAAFRTVLSTSTLWQLAIRSLHAASSLMGKGISKGRQCHCAVIMDKRGSM